MRRGRSRSRGERKGSRVSFELQCLNESAAVGCQDDVLRLLIAHSADKIAFVLLVWVTKRRQHWAAGKRGEGEREREEMYGGRRWGLVEGILVERRLEVLVVCVHLVVLAAGRDPFPTVNAQAHKQSLVYMTADEVSSGVKQGTAADGGAHLEKLSKDSAVLTSHSRNVPSMEL